MPVKITIEHHERIVATVETARPDIAAQLTYDAVETALDEDCQCEEEAAQDAEDQAIADFLYGLAEDAEECDCPPGRCFVEEEMLGEDPLFDPNEYQNGNEGLSLSESASRATSQVAEILNRQTEIDSEDFDRIMEVSQRAISLGISRYALYRMAGELAREYRDEGLYRGIPLSHVFQIRVDKSILSPEFS